jgi:hypothetical protein
MKEPITQVSDNYLIHRQTITGKMNPTLSTTKRNKTISPRKMNN